jgi:hypothetical protein
VGGGDRINREAGWTKKGRDEWISIWGKDDKIRLEEK